MYMDDYRRWCAATLEDAALTAELKEIAGDGMVQKVILTQNQTGEDSRKL